MKRKFNTMYDATELIGFEITEPSLTDPYQYTPTSVLFARSMEAGAMAKIQKMNDALYADNEELESDEVTPLDYYPPDIAESYQAIRHYRKKIKEQEKIYYDSLKRTEDSNESISEGTVNS